MLVAPSSPDRGGRTNTGCLPNGFAVVTEDAHPLGSDRCPGWSLVMPARAGPQLCSFFRDGCPPGSIPPPRGPPPLAWSSSLSVAGVWSGSRKCSGAPWGEAGFWSPYLASGSVPTCAGCRFSRRLLRECGARLRSGPLGFPFLCVLLTHCERRWSGLNRAGPQPPTWAIAPFSPSGSHVPSAPSFRANGSPRAGLRVCDQAGSSPSRSHPPSPSR